jgi:SpoVK/Ycf46/Vps4 family AAA+-type ATPase
VLSKWYGESEANVRRLFEDARRAAPAVIFIDEVDSLLGRRAGAAGDGPGGASEASRRVTNEFLSYIDGIHTGGGGGPPGGGVGGGGRGDGNAAAAAADAASGRVVVIAATNAPWELDEAALSRFAARVLVPLPDARARVDIVRGAMGGVACDMGEADWRRVAEATATYSGRDLMSVCREASMRPLRELWGNRVLEGGAPRHAQRQRQLVTAVAAALRRGVPRRRMRRELDKWKRAETGAAAWCDVDAVIAEAEAANAGKAGAKLPAAAAAAAQQQRAGSPAAAASPAKQQLQPQQQQEEPAADGADASKPNAAGGLLAAEGAPPEPQQQQHAVALRPGAELEPEGTTSPRASSDGKDTWTVEELLSLPADALRPVVLADFEAALQTVASSECELASKFEEWSAKYGSGGGTRRREDAWRSMPMYL